MSIRNASTAAAPRADRRGPGNEGLPAHPVLDMQAWLDALGALRDADDAALALEIDLPFCVWQCLYCQRDVEVGWDLSSMAAYVAGLEREIELLAGEIGRDHPVATVHFGGGSPNHVHLPLLGRLAQALRRALPATAEAEWSIGCDPRRSGAGQMDRLRAMGFRHLRIGQADLDPEVQAAAGRVQSCRLVDDVMGLARAARFRSVQLEVVCGLPGQDMARWQRTLECLLWLGPERIRVLPLRAGSPACGSPLAELPDPALRERLWRCAVDRLCAAGYLRIGDELFVLEDDPLALAAQAGRLRRSGETYVDQPVAARFAFGPGTCSEARGMLAWNESSRDAWEAALADGRWPLAGVRPAGPLEQARRAAADRLLCTGRLPAGLVQALPASDRQRLVEDEARGWVLRSVDGWTVTPEGGYHLGALARRLQGPLAGRGRAACAS